MEAKVQEKTAQHSQNAISTTTLPQDSGLPPASSARAVVEPNHDGNGPSCEPPPSGKLETESTAQSLLKMDETETVVAMNVQERTQARDANSNDHQSKETIPNDTAQTGAASHDEKAPLSSATTTAPVSAGNDQASSNSSSSSETRNSLNEQSTNNAKLPSETQTASAKAGDSADNPTNGSCPPVQTTTPSQQQQQPPPPVKSTNPPVPAPATTAAAAVSTPMAVVPEIHQMITRGFGPSAEETLERLRAPLTDAYAPYIHATDRSLIDARRRLKTALEQTRQLRAAFTDRVYKKYKIVLRPVPGSVEAIVAPIMLDPITVSRKLQDQMNDIAQEKATERKEATKAATAKPPVGPDGAPLPNAGTNAAETAEQIQFLTSGLGLVILPEDEVEEGEIDLSQIKYRGPVNPETGQKVVGLSAAAATAAEAVLDRVRRGGALRIERQRRRQLQLLTGEAQGTDNGGMYASTLLSGDAARRAQKPKAKGGPRKTSPSYPSGKANRSRISAALSGSNLLSLSASSEELKTDGTRSAATAALVSSGVGVQRTIQQRWQHPYPDSLGGRRALTAASTSTKPLFDANGPIDGQHPPESVARNLPPLPVLKVNKKPVKIVEHAHTGTERARNAVERVLEQFVDAEKLIANVEDASEDSDNADDRMDIGDGEATVMGNDADAASGSKSEAEKADSLRPENMHHASSTQKKCRKRGATEIGLMRSLWYAPEQEMKPHFTDTKGSIAFQEQDIGQAATCSTAQVPASTTVGESPIPPALAFSVMHALGLVKESSNASQASSRNDLSLIDFTVFKDNAADGEASPESRMQALSKRILGRKRSFSCAFLSNRTQSTHDKDAPNQVLRSERIDNNNASTEEIATKRPREESREEPSKSALPTEDADKNDSTQESAAKRARTLSPNEEHQGKTQGERAPSNGCPVLSIRGGGKGIDGAEDPMFPQDETTTGKESAIDRKSRSPSGSPRPSPSSHEASLHNQALLAELTQHPLSLLSTRRPASASDALYSGYSPPRNSASGDRGGPLHHQHSNNYGSPTRAMQLAHGAYSMNRFPSPPARLAGDMSEYFGTPHASGYTSRSDWPPLGNASSGYLPPPHASIASMGLAGHRAAMVELSVRDRAARALLAREQQQNAAVAAHAAAAHRHASMAGLSQAAFMGPQPMHGADPYYGHSTSGAGHFTQLGRAHSAPVAAAPTGQGEPNGSRLSKTKKSSKKANPSRSCSSKGEKDDGGEMENSDVSCPRNRETDGSVSVRDGAHRKDVSRGKEPRNGEESLAADNLENTKSDEDTTGKSIGDGRANLAAKDISANNAAKEDFLPPPTNTKSKNHTGHVSAESSPTASSVATTGMQFVLPVSHQEMPAEVRTLILEGKFYSVLDDNEASSVNGSSLIEYVLALGTAVPIPKAIILNPLKERLNTPGFKSQSTSATPPVPREVVVAIILVWLWAEHKGSFQRAFSKSGRIDVDPECKWLIQTAVEASVRALMMDIADAVARGGSMATALSGGRAKASAQKLGGQGSAKEGDRPGGPSTSVDIHVARIVSQGLMSEFGMDDSMDEALPSYHDLVDFLDEARLHALRIKSSERALLAALISRNATMSEQFSHAYTSAMVRAGEALGHEDLFEHVQDSGLMISTMMPYDMYSDETGAWEDSCRPEGGFSANLPGEELIRRAHARAMIQKSLRKLQDRLNISGGTQVCGPYTNNPNDASAIAARPPVQRTPSSGTLRRRSSFSTASETSFNHSSGTAVATSLEMYNPRHYSAPLFFDVDEVENKPYGKHMKGYRERSFSFRSLSFSGSADDSESTKGRSKKRQKLARTNSISISPRRDDEENDSSLPRSTQEIDWVDVADIFQLVALGPTTPTSGKGQEADSGSSSKTIIAPFCRRVETPPGTSDDEGGEKEEEDISDEAVLARHKVVLDRMKVKIDKAMEARQQQARPQGFQRGPRGRGRGR